MFGDRLPGVAVHGIRIVLCKVLRQWHFINTQYFRAILGCKQIKERRIDGLIQLSGGL
jgi:hypothetical protein